MLLVDYYEILYRVGVFSDVKRCGMVDVSMETCIMVMEIIQSRSHSLFLFLLDSYRCSTGSLSQ